MSDNLEAQAPSNSAAIRDSHRNPPDFSEGENPSVVLSPAVISAIYTYKKSSDLIYVMTNDQNKAHEAGIYAVVESLSPVAASTVSEKEGDKMIHEGACGPQEVPIPKPGYMTAASSTLAATLDEANQIHFKCQKHGLKVERCCELATGIDEEARLSGVEGKTNRQFLHDEYQRAEGWWDDSHPSPNDASLYNAWRVEKGIFAAQAVADHVIKPYDKAVTRYHQRWAAIVVKLAQEQVKSDDLMEKSALAMHIAEGDEGWEKASITCPMLQAVYELRRQFAQERETSMKLNEILLQHHKWHLDLGEQDASLNEIDLSAEYADSEMCSKTEQALAAFEMGEK